MDFASLPLEKWLLSLKDFNTRSAQPYCEANRVTTIPAKGKGFARPHKKG